MKLLLLHGAGIEVSRRKLLEIKKKFNEENVVVFDPSAHSDDSGQVIASLQTMPMFHGDRLIIWENPPEDILNDLAYTLYPNPYVSEGKESSAYTLIFWFDHEVKKLPQKSGLEILYFPEAKEVSVFPFLDMLADKNPKAYLELDKLKKGGYDTQYILTMIFYLLRSLIYIPKTSPDFVRKKVARQRGNFSSEDIKNLYRYVLETDFKIKKGLMDSDHAQFLLVNLFTH